MNIIIQVEDISPPVLAAEGALCLSQSPPHGSTLGVNEQRGMKENHEAVNGRHAGVAIKDGLEEVDHAEILLVLLVLHKLNGEQES